MPDPIYLDYNATAPIRPQVRDAMLASMSVVGNASSVHGFGRDARRQVEKAREQVASLISARAQDVIFTASGTEANNQILKAWPQRHLFVSAIEHDSIRDVEADRQTQLPVGADGRLDVERSLAIVSSYDGPSLVALMLVNNETGIIQPVVEMTQTLKSLGQNIHVHCDAVQAAGKMPVSFADLGVDSLSISAHKIGGPQGVGALVHRPGLEIPRFIDGGGQERRLRAGTENVAGIVGFGVAADCCAADLATPDLSGRMRSWRAELVAAVRQANPDVIFLSESAEHQLGTTLCFSVPGVRADTMVMKADLNGLAISAGSACSSGKVNVSPVALAMGQSDAVAQGSVRISIGWATSEDEIHRSIAALSQIVKPKRLAKNLAS